MRGTSRRVVGAGEKIGLEGLEARQLLWSVGLEQGLTELVMWNGQQVEMMKDSWILTFEGALGKAGAAAKAGEVAQALGIAATNVDGIGRGKFASLKTPTTLTWNDVIRAKTLVPGLKGIDPNTVRTPDALTPNDQQYSNQWMHANSGQPIPPPLGASGTLDADIDTDDAWEIVRDRIGTVGSENVVVAVLDTGIDLTHPDLIENLWHNPGEIAGNGIDDDGNGFIDDVFGWDFFSGDNDPQDTIFGRHGTPVAGLIGAVGNNNLGVAGVNWTVSMMALRVGQVIIDTVSVIGSNEYVIQMKTQFGINIVVTNNSYGGIALNIAEQESFADLTAAGVIAVASAGNDSLDNDLVPHYPSSFEFESLIAVAATDNNDIIAGFSDFGLISVDLAAPGPDTLSTEIGGGYEYFSGTSASSPVVAGAVALLKAARPEASNVEIIRALYDGVDLLPSLQGKMVTGGRLNVLRSLQLLLTEGPRIVAITPGPVTGSVSSITVEFSEDISPATFTSSGISFRKANGDSNFDGDDTIFTFNAMEATISGSTLTIDLTAQFPSGLARDSYRLILDDAAFRDSAGNRLNGNLSNGIDETYDFRVETLSGAFEPNDSLAQATAAAFNASGLASITGVTVGDGFFAAKDVDVYRFTMSGPGLISVNLTAKNLGIPSALDSFLRLFNASGAELANNDNFNGLDSRIDLFVANGGTYYIGVSGFGNQSYNPNIVNSGAAGSTGEYELTIQVSVSATETRTFTAGDLPRAILTSGTSGTMNPSATILITDIREVVDANVRLLITHTAIGDLQVRLVSPSGTSVSLMLNRGGNGDNLGIVGSPNVPVVFDDEASLQISAGVAPYSLTPPTPTSFRPDSPLSAFDGQSAEGTWTLQIVDTKALDTGTLVGFEIELTLRNNIFGAFELNDSVAIATDSGIAGRGTATFNATIGDGAFGRRDVDIFRLNAAAGTTINITATRRGGGGETVTGVDLVGRLLDFSGAELKTDDRADTTSASLTFIVDQGGTFFVGISGSGNAAYNATQGGSGSLSTTIGDYTLTIQIVGGLSDGAVILTGDRLSAGINPDGTLGVTGTVNRGLSLDGIDFLFASQAGHVIQSFYGATFNGFTFLNTGTSTQAPVLLANESDFSNRRVVADMLFRNLSVRRSIAFGTADSFMAIDIVLTNTSLSTMTDVAWMELFNPDQGLNRQTNNAQTVNNRQNATGRLVTAAWFDNSFPGGLTVGLAAPDASGLGLDVVTSVERSAAIRDPFQILDDANDPDPAGDAGTASDSLLSIAYNAGSISPGESVRFRYFMLLGRSLTDVNTLFSTIESGTGGGHLVPSPVDGSLDPTTLPYSAYYPEGYANDRASTFIPMLNGNADDARVVVIVHYERGFASEVVFDSVVTARTRSGITITTPAQYAANTQLVRKDEPYSLEIRSSLPIGATLSHYDFGVATGETFTTEVSDTWTFGEGFRGDGVHDFLVFFNSSDEATKVTLEVYPENFDGPITVTQEVAANKRGGWSLENLPELIAAGVTGPFGMRVTADNPIVAALSHYDTNIGGGFGILGQTNDGTTTGATPEGQLGINADSEFVTVLNTNTTEANITFTFFFQNGSAYRQLVTIPAARRGGFAVQSLPNFPIGEQAYSIAYESDVPVTVDLPSFAFGEATGSAFSDKAHTGWIFSEGFRPTNGENVRDYLRIYNPTAVDQIVEITISFNDGSSEVFRRIVRPRASNDFDVFDFVTPGHQNTTAVGSFYGLRIRSAEPVVAYMGHFDTFFGGGFGTLGTPYGTVDAVI